MQNMNQPIQTWILADNAMRLGHFNQSGVNPSQENRSAKGPPPGFQMAPCGCYFDPRIYRIEWIPNEFPQSSVCKLIQVPGMQNMSNNNWADGQRYPKNPVQPTAFTKYQHTQENKQYTVSHHKKADLNNVNGQGNVTGLFPETQAEIMKVMKQVKEHQKDGTTPSQAITNSAFKNNGDVMPRNANSNHNDTFLSQGQMHMATAEERPRGNQRHDNYPDQQANFKAKGHVDSLISDSEGRPIWCRSEDSPVNIPDNVFWNPSTNDPQMTQRACLLESQEVKKSHFCHLPTTVLLEDAMRMFDALPTNADGAEFDDSSSSVRIQYADSKDEFEIDDLKMHVSDNDCTCRGIFRALSVHNMSEDLLSADYNVPENSEMINSMEYLNNVGEIAMIPSPNQATTQSLELPQITSSPIGSYMDIQECLEKMDEC